MSSWDDSIKLPLLYESLPPVLSGPSTQNIAAIALARTLSGFGDIVDAVLVPQVEDESAKGLRIDRPAKDDAIAFAARYLEAAQGPAPRRAIVAQPLTHLTEPEIRTLLERSNRAGIAALAVVGPSSRAKANTAPTSTAAAIACCAADQRLRAGAIAIHARAAESDRMVAKVRAGAEFFLSQIYYDADSMARTIAAYAQACRDAEIAPARLFLSLAPVISPATARLMARIINPGNRLPAPAASIPPAAIGPTSIAYLVGLLAATLAAGEEFDVPLGVSIGHVTERNVRLSFELLTAVADLK